MTNRVIINTLLLFLASAVNIASFAAVATSPPTNEYTRPQTFRLIAEAAILSNPDGEALYDYETGTRFTSNIRNGEWRKITGYFPEKKWEKAPQEMWIHSRYIEDISPPEEYPRKNDQQRFIIIDKSEFSLNVMEKSGQQQRILFHTKVGLGMDRCLPEEEGGRCYFTEPGNYHVRWKSYNPDGIDWCIPESMLDEARYQEDIKSQQRCFKAALGYFALNIGKTYAIHGTRNDETIGTRSSHGCIRASNDDIKEIWRYMRDGDAVYIVN